jgi:hypothetical protein
MESSRDDKNCIKACFPSLCLLPVSRNRMRNHDITAFCAAPVALDFAVRAPVSI